MREVSVAWTRESLSKTDLSELDDVVHQLTFLANLLREPAVAKTAKDGSNPGSLQQFDQKMAAAVAPYGKYISSAGHTPKYSGGDGIHYGGSEGNQIARQWADGIFREVTRA